MFYNTGQSLMKQTEVGWIYCLQPQPFTSKQGIYRPCSSVWYILWWPHPALAHLVSP